jgi:endonuclease/exonuclease/phosphatase family metal-dependent hydrolase
MPTSLRIATFNASMFRDAPGALKGALEAGDDPQIKAVAHIIQTIRPDVLLLNEFDWDEAGEAARQMRKETLMTAAAEGLEGIDYPYVYVPGTNTGIASGADLDKNGQAVTTPGSRDYGNDAFGYGTFHGQYGMIILSKYPIDEARSRTFQDVIWKDVPGTLMPTDWYLPEAVEVMRLSSKNHADVVINLPDHALHVLASHPTPPGFDGDEDRNGKRNHDEIQLWNHYITDSLTDDAGVTGGLPGDEPFVIMGDLNSDPRDGGSLNAAINALIALERVQDPEPTSPGATAASARDGQVNTTHQGDAALDTADFSDGRVGNLRVDYVLPSGDMTVNASAVVWPAPEDPLAETASRASDHHMVWVDVELK